ncbi:MAG: monooxygenase, partial [Pseudomonadota bacterium]
MLEQNSAQVHASATQWLSHMQTALAAGREDAIAALFVTDAWWRDIVGASWRIQTVGERAAIAAAIVAADNTLREIALAEDHPAPAMVQRAGRNCIELFFTFTTAHGNGTGVARLIGMDDSWRCWTLMTALDTLHDPDAAADEGRSTQKSHSRDF